MRLGRKLGQSLTLLAAMLPAFASAADFPPMAGRVTDAAHILSERTEAALEERLADLERQTGRQVAVATVSSLGGLPIEEYASQLGYAWSRDGRGWNRGVLIVVAPAQRLVRIHVASAMERELPTSEVDRILRERVLPKFANGNFDDGVHNGADAVIAAFLRADLTRRNGGSSRGIQTSTTTILGKTTTTVWQGATEGVWFWLPFALFPIALLTFIAALFYSTSRRGLPWFHNARGFKSYRWDSREGHASASIDGFRQVPPGGGAAGAW